MESLLITFGAGQTRLLAWSALPDAPVVPDHPHRLPRVTHWLGTPRNPRRGREIG